VKKQLKQRKEEARCRFQILSYLTAIPPPLIVGLSPYTRLKLGYPCRFLMKWGLKKQSHIH